MANSPSSTWRTSRARPKPAGIPAAGGEHCPESFSIAPDLPRPRRSAPGADGATVLCQMANGSPPPGNALASRTPAAGYEAVRPRFPVQSPNHRQPRRRQPHDLVVGTQTRRSRQRPGIHQRPGPFPSTQNPPPPRRKGPVCIPENGFPSGPRASDRQEQVAGDYKYCPLSPFLRLMSECP